MRADQPINIGSVGDLLTRLEKSETKYKINTHSITRDFSSKEVESEELFLDLIDEDDTSIFFNFQTGSPGSSTCRVSDTTVSGKHIDAAFIFLEEIGAIKDVDKVAAESKYAHRKDSAVAFSLIGVLGCVMPLVMYSLLGLGMYKIIELVFNL
ncbi:MAG: hypothetical protein HRU15_04495 [Planctomycetes bacterium]|nr:hypothetical protein [Planctomycetota bacterium]